MARCPPPDERLGNRWHFDTRLHPRNQANLFQSILQRQSIDNSGEHTHIVGSGTVHTKPFSVLAAPDIATTHHNGDFNAQPLHALYLAGNALHDARIDTIALLAHQRLAAELQQNTLESRSLVGHSSSAEVRAGRSQVRERPVL